MDFFNRAVDVLQILVTELSEVPGVWGRSHPKSILPLYISGQCLPKTKTSFDMEAGG